MVSVHLWCSAIVKKLNEEKAKGEFFFNRMVVGECWLMFDPKLNLFDSHIF